MYVYINKETRGLKNNFKSYSYANYKEIEMDIT